MARCSKCIMPDSVPGADFNERNECRWCREGYPGYEPLGPECLHDFLAAHRSPHAGSDCLVGVSGGKDSCFALYRLVTQFGIRAEAFTYEHEGVAEFARRNVRAMCDSLGVPLHTVSLAPHAHLESFRTFFECWVNTPTRISAAMLCVACKHLHALGTEIAAARKIPTVVWANCPLENAPFLALKKKADGYGREGLTKGALLLASEIAASPRFAAGIVRHLRLCTKGCLSFEPTSRYLQLRYPGVNCLFFFAYHSWNGDQIRQELEANTPWTAAPDLSMDWHSDCLFNVFKEYVYQKMFAATYTDVFLSNQVRHGLLTRADAWHKLVESKRQFASQLPGAIRAAGLELLQDRIDLHCFDIDASER